MTSERAKELSKLDRIVLLCGHYEGVDERVNTLIDEEISIGDYVLTGGELPAQALQMTLDHVEKVGEDLLIRYTLPGAPGKIRR